MQAGQDIYNQLLAAIGNYGAPAVNDNSSVSPDLMQFYR
jgi:hypothetical protein